MASASVISSESDGYVPPPPPPTHTHAHTHRLHGYPPTPSNQATRPSTPIVRLAFPRRFDP
jgi:hypothetical protein